MFQTTDNIINSRQHCKQQATLQIANEMTDSGQLYKQWASSQTAGNITNRRQQEVLQNNWEHYKQLPELATLHTDDSVADSRQC